MSRLLIKAAMLVLPLATIPAASATAQVEGNQSAENAVPLTLIEQRAADIVAVLNGELEAEEVFAAGFLSAVSPAQLTAMNAQLAAQFGPILGVEEVEPVGEYRAQVTFRFERALGSGGMALSSASPNLVEGLRLSSFEPIDDSGAKIEAELDALPGDVSVYFGPLSGGDPVFVRDADTAYPIGSTMKLYILSALSRSVMAGERDWDDVVPLSVSSLPSGQLQDWPQGTPMTLQTLATMMISTSDNTATDQLLSVLGRETVEAELRASGNRDAARSLPFLSTLEMFALKSDAARGALYAEIDEDGQRAFIKSLAAELGGTPDNADISPWSEARLIEDVEWFASTADLRGILSRIAGSGDQTALDIMAINRSMPEQLAEDWDYVGYKGGSEPGVLNLTWLLRDKSGAWHTLVMSWKDDSNTLGTATFDLIAQRILALRNDNPVE